MTRFVAIWAGQLVSMLGSAVTAFGLAVFVYQRTGDIGDLALIAAAAYLPQVVIAPYGGVLADRLDRRRLMIAADTGSALITGVMLWLVSAGDLGPWTATLLVAASASCNAVQWPAYEAALVALVPTPQLGRANGLCELGRGLSQLLAPAIAGALFGVIGLEGIIAIDLASFALGVTPLLFVRIPRRGVRATGAARSRAWLTDLGEAWRLIARSPGLVAMLALFSVTSFTFAVVELLLKPLVLAFGTPAELGLVLSSVGGGMVLGSIAMTAWGGPRRRIVGILVFQLVEGGALVLGGARPSVALLVVAALAYGVVIPLTFGCARYVWQVKVPHELQGRVAALRNAIVVLAIPIGYAVAAPLAMLGERLLAPDGALASSAGALIGVGAGRGTALVVILMGVITMASAAVVFGYPRYRHLERELDDLLVSSGRGDDD